MTPSIPHILLLALALVASVTSFNTKPKPGSLNDSLNLQTQDFTRDLYQKLIFKLEQSETGVIELTAPEFKKYILTKPRVFSAVIFFTAKDCTPCHRRLPQLEKVALLYKKLKKYRASRGDRNQPVRMPIFFVSIDIDKESMELARKFRVTHLPVVYYSKPKELTIKDEFMRKIYNQKYLWKVTSDDGVDASHKFLKWANKHSGNLEVKFKVPIKLSVIIISILVTFVSLITFVRIKWPSVLLNKNLWVFVAFSMYTFCAGGYLYTRVYEIPFFQFDSQGNVVFFMRKSRSQTGLEGFMISAVFIAFSWSLILLRKVVSEPDQNIILKWVMLIANLIAVLYLLSFLEEIFLAKNFYNPRFFPPKYFIKGPIHKDRGIIA